MRAYERTRVSEWLGVSERVDEHVPRVNERAYTNEYTVNGRMFSCASARRFGGHAGDSRARAERSIYIVTQYNI